MARVEKLYKLNELVNEGEADFYAVFGLTKECTEADVKKVYRKLSVICHPDNYVHESEEVQNMASDVSHYVNLMYDVLIDPVKRSHYDSTGKMVNEREYEQAKMTKMYKDQVDAIFEPIKDFKRPEVFAVPVTVPFKTVYHGGKYTFEYEGRKHVIRIPKGMPHPTMYVLRDEMLEDTVCVLAMHGTTQSVKVTGLDMEYTAKDADLKLDEEGNLVSVKVLGQWLDLSEAEISKNKTGTKYKITGYGLSNHYKDLKGDLVVKVVSKTKAKPKAKTKK